MKRIILFTAAISLFAICSEASTETNGDQNSAYKCGSSLVSDIDGNVYKTVLIGNHCWMAEKLKTNRDANGKKITRYCYENYAYNCENYGGLYTWATIMNGARSSYSNPSGVKGICPTGWHLPSDAEWTRLVGSVVAQGFPNSNVTNGAGNALKSCRQVNSPLGGGCNTSEHPRWNSHNTHHGFDEFGFAAYPGSSRLVSGTFGSIGDHGKWWSSTEYYSSTLAWNRLILPYYGFVDLNYHSKGYGFSVRCLRH